MKSLTDQSSQRVRCSRNVPCRWMKTPRDLFDGRTPEELVETGDPAQQRRVLEILIRIDYGAFS